MSIVDFGYEPAEVQVHAGDRVTWTNSGDFPHTVTFDDADCGRLSGGETVSAQFNQAGTYAYLCTIHPQMRATVIVQP